MFSPIDHYSEYYGDAQLANWRELCARDKAANIISLWTIVGHNTQPSIVDIGCGDGSVLYALNHHGFGQHYVGCEISVSAIVCARRLGYVKPVHFLLFDGMNLPIADKGFDLAILSHVLEHVDAPRMLLREASRVAKYVFVEVPLELNMRTPRNFLWNDVGHVNLYNLLIIRHLMQSVGLQILAERITCPSRAVFVYQHPGLLGNLHYAIKATLLKLIPGLAIRTFTYHSCLIAESIIDTR